VGERVRYLNEEIDNLKKELDFYRAKIKEKEDIEMAENAKADWTQVSTEGSNMNEETAFDATEKMHTSKFGPNTWLGDTGASVHYANNDKGMFDVTIINEQIKIGNGNSMYATKIGKLKRAIIQRNSDTFDVILMDVKYVPDLWVNLFSIGKA
jgi:hypothetical protein